LLVEVMLGDGVILLGGESMCTGCPENTLKIAAQRGREEKMNLWKR
jgi:hypothetical protein